MKNISKNIMMGLLVLGLSLSLSKISFAHKGEDAFMKLTSDSAAALQVSRPDLAAELKKWSDEEAAEEASEKKPKDQRAKPEVRTDAQKLARREAHLKLLKDSAAALQTSNPALSAELTKAADNKAKKMAEKKAGK